MVENKFERIRSALAEAESSLKLARQLLLEAEKGPVSTGGKRQEVKKEEKGVIGIFDGEQMVTEAGEKHPVPANYASKSLLVVGDTLKLIEEGGEKRFKQIEHVKRHKTVGILAKKDGKWHAVTPEGSYRVLPAAVEHFGGDVGEEVSLYLPANNLVSSFGAVEAVNKKVEEKDEEAQVEVKNPEASAEKKQEKAEVEKKPIVVKAPVPEIQKEKPSLPKIEKKPVEKKLPKAPEKVQEKEKPAAAVVPVPKPTVKPAVVDEDELA